MARVISITPVVALRLYQLQINGQSVYNLVPMGY